jgi:hypothetical protein
MPITRRTAVVGSFATLLSGCGGGGGGDSGDGLQGSIETRSMTARSNGATYPLYIYLPPDSDRDRASLPVIYALDGDTRFTALAGIVDGLNARVIVVGIGNDARRSTDYVPPNFCTTNGGGQAAYFDFIRLELTPYIEANIGGDPKRRVLWGHSHGGSFVFYALFAQNAGSHHFSTYLPADASIACMSTTAYGWEDSYAASNAALPVRLDVSYADNPLNAPFVTQIQSRGYGALTLASSYYPGGHIGMIPAAFSNAVSFVLAA